MVNTEVKIEKKHCVFFFVFSCILFCIGCFLAGYSIFFIIETPSRNEGAMLGGILVLLALYLPEMIYGSVLLACGLFLITSSSIECLSCIRLCGLGIRSFNGRLELFRGETVLVIDEDAVVMFWKGGWLIIWPQRTYETIYLSQPFLPPMFKRIIFSYYKGNVITKGEKSRLLKEMKIKIFHLPKYIHWPAKTEENHANS